MSVVHALKKGSSRDPSGVVMHLPRTLTFFSAIFVFVLRAQHVAGLENGPADAISRDNLSFHRFPMQPGNQLQFQRSFGPC